MEKREFSLRLAQLRENKGVSAREMSTSIGQCESYINGVENGVNFPSMTVLWKWESGLSSGEFLPDDFL